MTKRMEWVYQQQLAVPHGTVGQPSFGGLKHAPSHIFDTTTQATQSRAVIANADLPNVDAPPNAWCKALGAMTDEEIDHILWANELPVRSTETRAQKLVALFDELKR